MRYANPEKVHDRVYDLLTTRWEPDPDDERDEENLERAATNLAYLIQDSGANFDNDVNRINILTTDVYIGSHLVAFNAMVLVHEGPGATKVILHVQAPSDAEGQETLLKVFMRCVDQRLNALINRSAYEYGCPYRNVDVVNR